MLGWFYLVVAALALGVLCTAAVGELLSRPVRSTIGALPPDLPAAAVLIPYAGQEQLSGWQSRGNSGAGAVLLLHGVRSDRRQMIGRARFLHRLGYSVLLIDLPAHGESTGDRITFGVREAEGVQAALAHLRREMPSEPVGVIGISLGAAAFALGGPNAQVHAVILESMYPTIDEAVRNRLETYLGSAGGLLSPLLLWQLPLRAGVSPGQLRPVERVGGLGAAVFIISGAEDRRTTADESRELFRMAMEPKQLWIVDRAAHVDLHALAQHEYEQKVGAFLARHLGRAPANQAETNPPR
ncbi:alpha/beta fold hydrolase [Variovorax paradoxus]|nr:alpha/beta fold hydrolase [Variovorax paradoxus]